MTIAERSVQPIDIINNIHDVYGLTSYRKTGALLYGLGPIGT